MSAPQYVELHARSAFSFLRAGSLPETLVSEAARLGLPALAVCDRMGVYGAPRQAGLSRETGVRALHGAELVLEEGTVLPVLVADRRGYQNLCRLLTRAHLRAPKGEGKVRWSDLEEFAGGLVALTGDEDGPLLQAIRDSADAPPRRTPTRSRRAPSSVAPEPPEPAPEAPGACETHPVACLDRLQAIFGPGNVFIEIQRHRQRGEDRWNARLQELSQRSGLPLLATQGVQYATPAGRQVLDVFTCLRHHTTLDLAGSLLSAHDDRHLLPARSMVERFADLPTAIEASVRLAERLTFGLSDLGYEFPTFPVGPGETMESVLHRWTWAGAQSRYAGGVPDRIRSLLAKELDLIGRLGFAGYFLLVADLVRFCRDSDVLVQGRGSAANSAVCYCLGITAVDPVKFNVLFERFLSEGRKGWPDIDLDLPSGDRRERVIQEVYRRYGPHGAAMTATVISYRGRSAAREIGKVLGVPQDILDRFAALFGHGDFPHTLELLAQMEKAGLSSSHPRAPAFAELYRQISGLPRHLGQHTGGMILGRGSLDRIVPLENAAMSGRVVAQWDKDDCEDLGIIKIDLLGLGMMSALQDTVRMTAEQGHPVDLAQLPHDDPATFELMRRADTIGVFQIESRAQMATLPRMKPKGFYDLVIEVAIIRPGPIQGDLAHPYLRRRDGVEPVTYWDERLRPVLERTLGVPLFQEQMLQIAMVMARFTGDEAEELRKALSFHRSDERMQRSQSRLREAMRQAGVTDAVSEQIARAVGSFALYGFPESHAISFAHLAYASAYLKAHRPAEFYCALLNNQPMGFYSPATLIQDARRHGILVRPVCVLHSHWEGTLENPTTVRLGLRQVQTLRRAHAEQMLAERARADFVSMEDFRRRTRWAREELRVLAEIGALNGLAGHRRAALWEVEKAIREDELPRTSERPSTPSRQAHHAGDRCVVGNTHSSSDPFEVTSPLRPMGPAERLAADFEVLRLTTGPHPLRFLREQLKAQGVWTAAAVAGVADACRVIVAGQVICRQRPGTAKGVCFISLEDETGIANVIVSPKLFEAERLRITTEPFLKIVGRARRRHGTVHVDAERIDWLEVGTLALERSHDFR